MALCCFNRGHIYISNRENTTIFYPRLCCLFLYCCEMDSFQLVGSVTPRARDNDKCNVWGHSFHCPAPALLSGHLTVDIRYCQREARAHCPTWSPSLHDTVQTLTIHTEPYLSTYHRNPTVHFYLFSSSYHLISYWDQPPTWITISNRLVTSFLCASDCHNVGELDNSNYFRRQARVSSVQCQY